MIEIYGYPMKDLDLKQLELMCDVHRRMEMTFALTDELLGLKSGLTTAKEVEAILRLRNESRS